jgi:hypothetical protein
VDSVPRELNHISTPMSTTEYLDTFLPLDGDKVVRKTPGDDPRVSAVDVAVYVTGQSNDDSGKILRRLQDRDMSFWNQLEQYQFKGRGQTKQFVLSRVEVKRLVAILPGPEAAKFRSDMCQFLDTQPATSSEFENKKRKTEVGGEDAGTAFEGLKCQLAASRQEVDDLQIKLASFEGLKRQEVSDLKSDFATERNDLKRKLASLEDLKTQEVNDLKRIFASVEPQLAASRQEVDDVRRKLASFEDVKTQLAASRQAMEDLKTELDVDAGVSISHIVKRFNKGHWVRGLLQDVYRLHPIYRGDHKLQELQEPTGFTGSAESRESYKAAVMNAIRHYHTDKNGSGMEWHYIICLHITKLLNAVKDYIHVGDKTKVLS